MTRSAQPMSPGYFDTRRRLLGLSIDDVADLLSVNPATINRYMNAKVTIHDGVAGKLDGLEQSMLRSVEDLVAKAKEKSPEGHPVRLTRYRTQEALDLSSLAANLPLGAHALVVGWTAEALEADGYVVEIEFAK